jgi:hypothetical protein
MLVKEHSTYSYLLVEYLAGELGFVEVYPILFLHLVWGIYRGFISFFF